MGAAAAAGARGRGAGGRRCLLAGLRLGHVRRRRRAGGGGAGRGRPREAAAAARPRLPHPRTAHKDAARRRERAPAAGGRGGARGARGAGPGDARPPAPGSPQPHSTALAQPERPARDCGAAGRRAGRGPGDRPGPSRSVTAGSCGIMGLVVRLVHPGLAGYRNPPPKNNCSPTDRRRESGRSQTWIAKGLKRERGPGAGSGVRPWELGLTTITPHPVGICPFAMSF